MHKLKQGCSMWPVLLDFCWICRGVMRCALVCMPFWCPRLGCAAEQQLCSKTDGGEWMFCSSKEHFCSLEKGPLCAQLVSAACSRATPAASRIQTEIKPRKLMSIPHRGDSCRGGSGSHPVVRGMKAGSQHQHLLETWVVQSVHTGVHCRELVLINPTSIHPSK